MSITMLIFLQDKKKIHKCAFFFLFSKKRLFAFSERKIKHAKKKIKILKK